MTENVIIIVLSPVYVYTKKNGLGRVGIYREQAGVQVLQMYLIAVISTQVCVKT